MRKIFVLLGIILSLGLQAQIDQIDKNELTASISPSEGADYSFDESMNNEIFVQINQERVSRGLSELRYNFVMQNTLDQVADGLKTNFCHCYGQGNYVTETLYETGSVSAMIKDLASSSKNNNPLKLKNIKYISIGISDNSDNYLVAIRTY